MAHHAYLPMYDSNRPHDPWQQFKIRDESKYAAEDSQGSRLCPSPSTTPEVIRLFLTHKRKAFERQIPHQDHSVVDFFATLRLTTSRLPLPSVETDIISNCGSDDIALVDDRRKHEKCAKSIGQPCPSCQAFSTNLSIPKLYERLKGQRSTQKAERRIIFLPNITPAAALGVAATVSKRSAEHFREFLQKYLCREHDISAITLSWGFFFEFHICYHALRPGPKKIDSRLNGNGDERLRSGELLPLRQDSRDRAELYFYEAESSSLCWGPDEWFWTELFLVETWFGSEQDHKTYLEDEFDPPLAGGRTLHNPCYDPREYFLLKLDRRLEQASSEYSALIGIFNQRMKEYALKIRHKFHDDDDQNLTRTLSDILDTVQTFVDCIGGITDAWDVFRRTQIFLFTTHAPEKLSWPPILDRIMRHIFKLARLRNLLLIQRERFKSKLDSLHTVSSLNQTDTANKQAGTANLQTQTAVAQGTDLKILTQMTVYVAFPLLFTTAFFSMDFVKPPYPGAVFTGVLIGVGLLNYLLAWVLRGMASTKKV